MRMAEATGTDMVSRMAGAPQNVTTCHQTGRMLDVAAKLAETETLHYLRRRATERTIH